ncbi:G3BP2 protein, partial [Polyodon spathula]|nr:G3BP2 protein [Polyodon spathula]
MVMEKPSSLLVGREFVRQYYTLLNKAPDFLHRFYGRNSSYVHGGLDASGKPVEAVYGQAEIHKKVMSLQFSECHTKIRHVDAHATLTDGVVVQVMGELSNNGQPMRKFMQTFVLAPEGSVANKFYVHNDIFRYEDEVFGDSEAELDEGKKAEKPAVKLSNRLTLTCLPYLGQMLLFRDWALNYCRSVWYTAGCCNVTCPVKINLSICIF